jgi:formylmethanofuran dehydrogenase subunit E
MECSFCGKDICSSCAIICEGCKKVFCKDHAHKANNSQKMICRDCTKRCSSCGLVVLPREGKNVKGRIFCDKCYSREKGKDILEDLFGS